MNTKEKGNIALSAAIRHYTIQGNPVSIPLSESTKYDLIVEKEGKLYKVQCKYTNCKNKYGNFVAPLRVMGGNQSFHTIKVYKEGDFDFLFIETSKGYLYEIPSFVTLKNRNSITLHEKHEEYRIIG